MRGNRKTKMFFGALAPIAAAGAVIASSYASSDEFTNARDTRIAPHVQKTQLQPRPKRKLVSHGGDFAWRINGDEGASFG